MNHTNVMLMNQTIPLIKRTRNSTNTTIQCKTILLKAAKNNLNVFYYYYYSSNCEPLMYINYLGHHIFLRQAKKPRKTNKIISLNIFECLHFEGRKTFSPFKCTFLSSESHLNETKKKFQIFSKYSQIKPYKFNQIFKN